MGKETFGSLKNLPTIMTCTPESSKSHFALDFRLFMIKLTWIAADFGGQFSSLNHLLWLLSGERGPPLEKDRYFQLALRA